jgi:hypothetical protein
MPDGRLVWRFPMPESEPIDNAYWKLERSGIGTETEKEFLGDHNELPKPWDVATCEDLEKPWDVATCEDLDLRRDVWDWYDRVVTWFNHEYVWDPAAGMIPPCWPLHPHLIHEVGVLASQRRSIEMAPNANALEEWHRYVVPSLLERTQKRVKQHCDDHHQPWPARARFTHHQASGQVQIRMNAFKSDLEASPVSDEDHSHRPHLMLLDDNGSVIDPKTGEVS